jgi:5-(carboxyamino)imidazole ribonucleotide synthase
MRIGILGSGQLGMMLALAGAKLGHTFTFYDASTSTCTSALGPHTVAPFDDRKALTRFAERCDVITYEFENVPCDTAHFLESLKPVFPPARALEVSQDRVVEKEFLKSLGIATPRFVAVSTETELSAACNTLGYPCIVKTRRLGYDGKGQYRISAPSDIAPAWATLGGTPLIVEGFVPFTRELSVIATRDTHGAIALYPLSYNVHENGILHRSEIPAPAVSADVLHSAYQAVTKVLEALSYVGTLTIELFEVRGEILANEIAPRVHNSGHATIESVTSSQFENHIRSISGTTVMPVEIITRAVMYNVVGTHPSLDVLKQLPDCHIHLYNKAPRAGRKLGHITLLNPTSEHDALVAELCSRCKEATSSTSEKA